MKQSRRLFSALLSLVMLLALIRPALAGNFTNDGQFVNETGAEFTSDGTFTNGAGGTVINRGTFTNNGTLNAAAIAGKPFFNLGGTITGVDAALIADDHTGGGGGETSDDLTVRWTGEIGELRWNAVPDATDYCLVLASGDETVWSDSYGNKCEWNALSLLPEWPGSGAYSLRVEAYAPAKNGNALLAVSNDLRVALTAAPAAAYTTRVTDRAGGGQRIDYTITSPSASGIVQTVARLRQGTMVYGNASDAHSSSLNVSALRDGALLDVRAVTASAVRDDAWSVTVTGPARVEYSSEALAFLNVDDPPKLTSVSGAMTVDYTAEGAAATAEQFLMHGTVALTFDHPLYLYRQANETRAALTGGTVNNKDGTGFLAADSDEDVAVSADSGAVRTVRLNFPLSAAKWRDGFTVTVNPLLAGKNGPARENRPLKITLSFDADAQKVTAGISDSDLWLAEGAASSINTTVLTPNVTSFQLNTYQLSAMKPGDTARLVATLLPADAAGEVYFTSADTSVATVSTAGQAANTALVTAGTASASSGTTIYAQLYVNGVAVGDRQEVSVTVSAPTLTARWDGQSGKLTWNEITGATEYRFVLFEGDEMVCSQLYSGSCAYGALNLLPTWPESGTYSLRVEALKDAPTHPNQTPLAVSNTLCVAITGADAAVYTTAVENVSEEAASSYDYKVTSPAAGDILYTIATLARGSMNKWSSTSSAQGSNRISPMLNANDKLDVRAVTASAIQGDTWSVTVTAPSWKSYNATAGKFLAEGGEPYTVKLYSDYTSVNDYTRNSRYTINVNGVDDHNVWKDENYTYYNVPAGGTVTLALAALSDAQSGTVCIFDPDLEKNISCGGLELETAFAANEDETVDYSQCTVSFTVPESGVVDLSALNVGDIYQLFRVDPDNESTAEILTGALANSSGFPAAIASTSSEKAVWLGGETQTATGTVTLLEGSTFKTRETLTVSGSFTVRSGAALVVGMYEENGESKPSMLCNGPDGSLVNNGAITIMTDCELRNGGTLTNSGLILVEGGTLQNGGGSANQSSLVNNGAISGGTHGGFFHNGTNGTLTSGENGEIRGVSCAVTLHGNGGKFPIVSIEGATTAVSDLSVPVPYNEAINAGALQAPKWEGGGKLFSGWYLDEGCETAANFDAVVTDALDLYAGWIEAYAMTFSMQEYGSPKDACGLVFEEEYETSVDSQTGALTLFVPKNEVVRFGITPASSGVTFPFDCVNHVEEDEQVLLTPTGTTQKTDATGAVFYTDCYEMEAAEDGLSIFFAQAPALLTVAASEDEFKTLVADGSVTDIAVIAPASNENRALAFNLSGNVALDRLCVKTTSLTVTSAPYSSCYALTDAEHPELGGAFVPKLTIADNVTIGADASLALQGYAGIGVLAGSCEFNNYGVFAANDRVDLHGVALTNGAGATLQVNGPLSTVGSVSLVVGSGSSVTNDGKVVIAEDASLELLNEEWVNGPNGSVESSGRLIAGDDCRTLATGGTFYLLVMNTNGLSAAFANERYVAYQSGDNAAAIGRLTSALVVPKDKELLLPEGTLEVGNADEIALNCAGTLTVCRGAELKSYCSILAPLTFGDRCELYGTFKNYGSCVLTANAALTVHCGGTLGVYGEMAACTNLGTVTVKAAGKLALKNGSMFTNQGAVSLEASGEADADGGNFSHYGTKNSVTGVEAEQIVENLQGSGSATLTNDRGTFRGTVLCLKSA